MAGYFARDGWKDITIAFPASLLELEEINQLAADIQLNLLVDSAYSASILAKSLQNSVGIFIEIDTGYHRSGLLPEDAEIDEIVRLLSASDNGFKLFGYVVEFNENGWGAPIPGAYVVSLSQEHGTVKIPQKFINKFKPGDVLGILPVHSCLAAGLP